MRKENSIKNMKYNTIAQLLGVLIQFVSRTFFVKILGSEYLGINGLFSNILTILSLADMGIGTILVYSMYKPLAYNDTEELKCLMNMYRKIYNFIAVFVFAIGVLITPFLKYLIKDIPDIPHINFIFFLYLINTVASYLCVYKISIINADQKNFIVTIRQQIINLIANIFMIIILVLSHNFTFYLLVQIFFSILSNIYLSKLAEKMYPFIKNTKGYELSKIETNKIKKDTMAMLLHKIGGVVVSGTDNLIMSVMIGLKSVGVYSNYILIINAIKKFTSQFFVSISASVGNLNAVSNIEYSYSIFKKIFFANFWIYTFCTISLINLYNPFINLWLGDKYTFSFSIVIAISISFYIEGMRQTVLVFRETMGLFSKDKFKPILESIVNLVFSIILAKKFGIIGIILGTIISMFFVCVWIESYVLYKHGFKTKIIEYIKLYFKYFIIGFVAFIITYKLNSFVKSNSIIHFCLKGVICLLIPNLIIIILTFRTEEFKYFTEIILSKIRKRGKRK